MLLATSWVFSETLTAKWDVVATPLLLEKQVEKTTYTDNVRKHQIWAAYSSRLEFFYRIGILKNLPEFTGKNLCQSAFFNKVAGLSRQL